MKLLRLIVPVIATSLLLFASSSYAQSANAKIGFVSIDRLLKDSTAAKSAQSKLEAEFSKRDKELQETAARLKASYEKLERDSAVMSDSDRVRAQRELADQDNDFQRRRREFTEDLNQRRNEELAAVMDKANKVIKQIADSDHFDMIFQEAVYVNPTIDITDKVLKQLNAAPSVPAK